MKQSLKPFKIRVRFLSRAAIIRAVQEGEPFQDQTVQVWGTDLCSAANSWGRRTQRAIYQIADSENNILFSNGGDCPIRDE